MLYHIPDDQPMPLLALGRAVPIRAIATTVDEANAAMAADINLSCIAVYGEFVLLANKDDMGFTPGTGRVQKAAGVVARMLQRKPRDGDWVLPAEATAAVTALQLALGIIPADPELSLNGGAA